jgi:ubiquinone/menaquinone biosynthesis C-methylase UbiE
MIRPSPTRPRLTFRMTRAFLRAISNVDRNDRHAPRGSADEARKISDFYDALAERNSHHNFWNWGYHDPAIAERTQAFVVHDGDRSDGLSEQLYCYVAMPPCIPESPNFAMLEVGCGMGEGLAFLSRQNPLGRFIGIDVSSRAIALARKRHAPTGVRFEMGSAHHMPVESGSQDAIISVESTHNYPSLVAFLAESARVLRIGGHLSIVDIVTPERLTLWTRLLEEAADFTCVAHHDISAQVRQSIGLRLARHAEDRRRRPRKSPIDRLRDQILDEGRKLMFGADFLAQGSPSFAGRFRKLLFGGGLDIRSYRHFLLRRT